MQVEIEDSSSDERIEESRTARKRKTVSTPIPILVQTVLSVK